MPRELDGIESVVTAFVAVALAPLIVDSVMGLGAGQSLGMVALTEDSTVDGAVLELDELV